jgi:cytochrome bd ubiquinol oxidase subunit II
LWNRVFYAGSLLATFSQGLMLGLYVTGFAGTAAAWVFAVLTGACVCAGYALLGATWLIIKTEGTLQLKAVAWARGNLLLTGAGIAAISIATPMLSAQIFNKWFAWPNLFLLMPIPLTTFTLFLTIYRSLKRLPTRLHDGNEYGAWVPFAASVGIFCLAFYGLAYSLFPWLVVDKITIWQAASAKESLVIIFVGAMVVLPAIIGYTAFAYRVFWGKARALTYY